MMSPLYLSFTFMFFIEVLQFLVAVAPLMPNSKVFVQREGWEFCLLTKK